MSDTPSAVPPEPHPRDERLDRLEVASDTTEPGAASPARRQVVLLLHGIRTRGAWQEMVAAVLEEHGEVTVYPIRYGYFDAFRFLIPGRARRKPVDRILREIRTVRDREADADISVIAHSFGTYSIARALADNPDIRLKRLVLCGSIVSGDFRWDKVNSQVEQVVNDCGTKDVWPVLAESVTWGYGSTGTFGFGTAAGVRDRFHPHTHGEYFRENFVRSYWAPFVMKGEVKGSQYETSRPTAPWWQSVLSVAKLRWLFLIAVVALLFLGGRAMSRGLDSASVTEGDAGAGSTNVVEDYWLTMEGMELFGANPGARVRLTANVNGTNFVYPSIAGIEWLELGPGMASQVFRLPPEKRIYTVRFEADVRVPATSSSPEITGILTSVNEDIVKVPDGIPFEGEYVLHTFDPVAMTRAARAEALVKYRITTDPD